MRVLSFFLLAAPAVAFLAPMAPKSSMALSASQRNNEVRRDEMREMSDDSSRSRLSYPDNPLSLQVVSRSDVMAAGLAALVGLGVALPALAAEEGGVPTMAPVDLGVAPTSYELSKEYYKDAAQVVNHMK